MSCLGDCWDVGPPPNSILFMPPPPIPSFLQTAGLPELLVNNTLCISAQLCEAVPYLGGSYHNLRDSDNRNLREGIGGEYVELPRKEIDNWSPAIGDTWLLVLVASAIGVLLLGALLAMFLLKCREYVLSVFGSSECSLHTRSVKTLEPRDCSTLQNMNSNKLVHPSETVLYHGNGIHADNRMVWAALTPRGTQHFISESYPADLVDYIEADDHYESIDQFHAAHHLQQVTSATDQAQPTHYSPYYKRKGTVPRCPAAQSFDNSGFVDYEYEDPTPLIEAYQLNDLMDNHRFQQSEHQYAVLAGGNTDMRCANMRRFQPQLQHYRPQVSSPTRIEHPNLPPLNLYPHNTLNKKNNGTLNYRNTEAIGTLPKYGI